MKKSLWWTIIVIVVILILAYFILTRPHPETSADIAKCIGKNLVVYTQIGCHFCEQQKHLFGDNYQYINEIVCNTDPNKCKELGITSTPTWIINGTKYAGMQSIEKLQELTGCK